MLTIILSFFTNFKKYIYIFLIFLVIFITFYFTKQFYNVKIDKINLEFTNYKNSILIQQNKLTNDNLLLNKKLQDKSNEDFQKYNDLQNKNNDLIKSINNNSKQLFINAKCVSSNSSKTENRTTSSLDNATTSKAIIDRQDAEAIISITNEADQYKSQLEALQNYVNNLLENNNK